MFAERFSRLLSEVLKTSAGEFARITGYDRSYVSHLRSGDRTPRPDRAAAGRLARAVVLCAGEKGALDELCLRVGAPPQAGEDEICSAVTAWLYESGVPISGKRREARRDQLQWRRQGSFGHRLGPAMELADMSALRLARSLNVDASLIAKYRSGLRVPRVNHPIIRDVSAVLAARIRALDRVAGLAQLIGYPAEALDDESTAARYLERWLRDFSAVDTSLIEDLLDRLDTISAGGAPPELPPAAAVPDEEAPDDRSEGYEGVAGLQRAVIRFLSGAVKTGQKEIWLYSDQSVEWLFGEKPFAARWAALMGAYVRGGGKIRIIHNVDRGLEEMTSAILNWLPLYFSGGIESWYCTRQAGERFSHTLFLAPGSACISAVCVAGREEHGFYRYTVQPGELDHWRIFFEDLLAGCRPLLTMDRGADASRLAGVLRGRTVHRVARALSLGTMPEELLRSMLARTALPKETEADVLADWAGQRELIEEKLRHGQAFECVTVPQGGKIPPAGAAVDTDRAVLPYTADEWDAHLRAALALSAREPNYRVYPMEEAPFERIKLILSHRMAVIACPAETTVTFTATHPLACRALVDLACRLEEQVDADRLTLMERYLSRGEQTADRPSDRKEAAK